MTIIHFLSGITPGLWENCVSIKGENWKYIISECETPLINEGKHCFVCVAYQLDKQDFPVAQENIGCFSTLLEAGMRMQEQCSCKQFNSAA